MFKELNSIWNKQSLSLALGQNITEDIYGGKLQINSKDVEYGDIFIALKGQNTDGHLYVKNALENGAAAAIVNRSIDNVDASKLIIVKNPLEAIRSLAMYKRTNSKAKFIGITGSVGKTSLKEAFRCAFSPCGKTFAGRGNFNNELGMLVNLASMPDDLEYAVFELGMNRYHEIGVLTHILKPDLAIINNVYNTHLVNFGDVMHIMQSKAEIMEGLNYKKGIIILPKDNKYYPNLMIISKALNLHNVYDFSEKTNASAFLAKDSDDEMIVNVLGQDVGVKKNNLPHHHLCNFIPLLLSVELLKCDMQKAIIGLNDYKIYPGRGNLIEASKGDAKFSIIDDSYNSSPASLEAAIKNFQLVRAGRKVIVIGDMLELGETEASEHIKFASILNDTNIDLVVTYGNLASAMCPHLTKPYKSYEDIETLQTELYDSIKNQDVFLIKASKSTGLSKVISFLTQQV